MATDKDTLLQVMHNKGLDFNTKDTQPTLEEIRAETMDRVEDFRSALVDFAKRVQDMAEEFDPDSWEFKSEEVTYDDIDNFHLALQAEMTSLDTDYEDLKTTVLDLEIDLETWADLKDEEGMDQEETA